jgi:hypothetical protein
MLISESPPTFAAAGASSFALPFPLSAVLDFCAAVASARVLSICIVFSNALSPPGNALGRDAPRYMFDSSARLRSSMMCPLMGSMLKACDQICLISVGPCYQMNFVRVLRGI